MPDNTVVNFWGSPLALTDGDVEASLARIPGRAGAPLLPEIVDVLMTPVKRTHLQPSGQNVYLSQQRADQALFSISLKLKKCEMLISKGGCEKFVK